MLGIITDCNIVKISGVSFASEKQRIVSLRQTVYCQLQIAGPAAFCYVLHHTAIPVFGRYREGIRAGLLCIPYFCKIVKCRCDNRGRRSVYICSTALFQNNCYAMIFYRLHILGVIQTQGGADFACDGRLTRRRSAVSLRRPGWGGHGKQHGSRQQSRQHPYAYFHNRHPFFVLRLQNSISM